MIEEGVKGFKHALFGDDKTHLKTKKILEPTTIEAGETEITVKTFPSDVETSRISVPEPGITIF